MRRIWVLLAISAVRLAAQQTTPAGPMTYPGPTIGEPNKKGEAPKSSSTTPKLPAAMPHPTMPVSAAPGLLPKDLKFPPLRPVQVPKVDLITLPNGLRIYLMEDHELPLVNGTALVRAGTLLDPADKEGLASLAASVMRAGGAGANTADKLNERLEDVAGAVEVGTGANSITFTFSSMKESTPEVLGYFKDILTAPRFDDGKTDEVRTQMRNAISYRNDDPSKIATREFSDIVYGRNTSYGREQDYNTLNNILRGDLEAFHKRYFFPKNVLLAIRGDFDPAAMKEQIGLLFGGWNAEQPAVQFPPPQPAPASEAAGIHLAVKKNVSQAFFDIGQSGGMFKDGDYAALTIMANILGESGNRLLRKLREISSRSNVTAKWEAGYDLPGLFEIVGTIPSLSATEAVKAIGEESERIRTAEVSDEELKNAKDSAINSLVFAFDTKAKTLVRMLQYQYYGYPADFIDRYQKALEAVTRADVLRVAKAHLKPEGFTIVLVGDPGDFIPPAESLNKPVHKIDLTIAEPKITAVKSDASSLEKGQAILARMQRAAGGLEKLAAVKDSTLVASYSVEQNGRVTPIKHTERWLSPAHYREDNDIGGGTISTYFDSEYGWITVPGGSISLEKDTLKQVRGNLFRQYQLLLQGASLPGRTVNAVDEHTIEIRGAAGEWVRLSEDPDTGLPVKVRYEGAARNGPPPITEEVWSDFREVAGIKVPFKMYITEGGRKYADVVIADFRVNSGLKVADLSRRP